MSNERENQAVENSADAGADLYDEAVGDGTTASVPSKPNEDTVVVESNASNYGASAVAPTFVPERRENAER